jgi:small subunit ribosomal protein S7
MARGKRVIRKLHEADPVYGNRLLTRFVNRVMRDGKKSTAEKEVYAALTTIKEKGEDPIKTLETVIQSVGPKREVRSRRVGGASYQVPQEVRGERRIALAIRWIIQSANKRSNKEYKTFSAKLSAELLDALKGEGESIKKRETVHRMADANKAFAHFKW